MTNGFGRQSLYEVTQHDKANERWFRSQNFDITFGPDFVTFDFRRATQVFQVEYKSGKRRVLLINTGDRSPNLNPAAIVVGEQTTLPTGLLEQFAEISSNLPDDLRNLAEMALK